MISYARPTHRAYTTGIHIYEVRNGDVSIFVSCQVTSYNQVLV